MRSITGPYWRSSRSDGSRCTSHEGAGSGILEFELEPWRMAARASPRRLLAPAWHLGLLYWYAMVPAHLFLFRRMTSLWSASRSGARSPDGGYGTLQSCSRRCLRRRSSATNSSSSDRVRCGRHHAIGTPCRAPAGGEPFSCISAIATPNAFSARSFSARSHHSESRVASDRGRRRRRERPRRAP